VGFETADDCCVYALPSGELIAQTVDFFTPVVDDPFEFGRIAAANALSDIYAMGGEPMFALSLIAWPVGKLPLEALADVLKGSGAACREAGIPVAGGHSIDGPEPLCGLCVTGRLPGGKYWRNVGARPGDALILTKPLGTGIATGLMKKGTCPAPLADAARASMTTLNAAAARAVRACGGAVHAVTDVTGFGLIGHAREMAAGADGIPPVCIELRADALPLLDGLAEYLADPPLLKKLAGGFHTGGAGRNRDEFGGGIPLDAAPAPLREIFFDPQTSGGLLIAVAPEAADGLLAALREARTPAAARIGDCAPAGAAPVSIR